MFLSWIFTVLTSVILGVVVTLVLQYYLFIKYFNQQEIVTPEKKIKLEPFHLPKVLLDVIHCNQLVTKESCIALNLLLQFLFHELRDTEKVRVWFRNKLRLEFEELLSRSTIGRMVANIKILEIDLGSEFPVINNIAIQDVKVNNDYSHIDTLDLKLDVNYSGGFRLVIEANMLLGKAAHISIKVNELYGEGRLQFTRLPYSHWSFTFYNEPKLQLQVESHFQGRPFHQITNFISSQIKKSLKKKHTFPNYKLRYKPFFTASENTSQASPISPGQIQMIIHRISRLNESISENCEIYCSVAADSLPWVEIVNYGKTSYYVLDLVITKKLSQLFGIVFRQEFVNEQNQICVLVEDIKPGMTSNQDEVIRDDIILTIDGKKVTSINQAQKFIKSAAFQFTMRVKRKVRTKFNEEYVNDSYESPITHTGLRRRKGSESESSSPSPTPSATGSPANKIHLKKSTSECSKPTLIPFKSVISDEADNSIKILKSKFMLNRQVIVLEECFTFQIRNDERYLNINVRSKENDTQNDKLLGYVNIPLIEVQNASDTVRNLRLKPPDSFAAANRYFKISQPHVDTCFLKPLSRASYISAIYPFPYESKIKISNNTNRNYKLSTYNGFIPLLCYGDIVLTLQHYPAPDSVFRTVPEIIEPNLTPESEIAPGFSPDEKKHDFIKTHFQTSTQCEFCGKKIWLKDAERCRDCGMTCHKKCVVKCKAGTICMPRAALTESIMGSLTEGNRHNFTNDEEILRSNLTPDGLSSRESTPQPTPTKKRLGNLLATVASASRGLKRVGSANNLALPGDLSQNALSKSLPPSPQQSPAPSRKASLPLELNEEIAILLQTLMEHGSDQGDMMDFAKETGKTLYEGLDLVERKEKIHEMINKLKIAINAEADVRFGLSKEEQLEKDPTSKAKIAFLIGKSDEKTQALTILMLHFCAGLQHIQDLEDQEREVDMVQDLNIADLKE